MERLYDKQLIQQLIEGSIVLHILSTGEEVLEETSTLKLSKNIITQKDYESDVKFIYAFPLGDMGVFIAHFEEEINDPGIHYDFFKAFKFDSICSSFR